MKYFGVIKTSSMLAKTTLSILSLLASYSLTFAVASPIDKLNKTIIATQNQLIENSDKYKKNPYQLLNLINKRVIPLVNSRVIAHALVGTRKWNQASKKEQAKFIKSITEIYTFIYAKNVAYAGEYRVILNDFKVIQPDKTKNIYIAIVNGRVINRNSNRSSELAIKMFNKDNKWSIYDIEIAGIAMLDVYRKQFANYKNIAQMIKAINDRILKIKQKNYPDLLDKASMISKVQNDKDKQ